METKHKYIEVRLGKSLLLYKDTEILQLLMTNPLLYKEAVRRGKYELRTRTTEANIERGIAREEDKFMRQLGFFDEGGGQV